MPEPQIEGPMKLFNSTQKPCVISGKRARLQWTGIHVIACGVDCQCAIHDGDNHLPDSIIRAWDQMKTQKPNVKWRS